MSTKPSMTNTPRKTIVTVTTVAGKPSFEMPDRPTRDQIDAAVLAKYGYHLVDPRVSAIRHSYQASVVDDELEAARSQITVGPFGHRGAALDRSDRRFHSGC